MAALKDITLEALEFDLRAYFDRRGGRLAEVPNRGVEEIRYELRIRSPEPPERIRELVEEGERHCYVVNTLRRAMSVSGRVMLNGALLMACPPEGGELGGAGTP